MNCTTCNTPLENNARFCRNCGQPVSFAASNNANAPANQPVSNQDEAPTIPPGQIRLPPPPQNWSQPAQQTAQQPPAQGWLQSPPYPQQPPAQPTYYQPNIINTGAPMQNRADAPRPRRRRVGCLARTLISLVLLVAILFGIWFVAVRPYLSNTAQTKLNSVLDVAVNSIPPQLTQAPAGPLAVKEQILNNILVLESSPNDLVKNAQVHITSSAMRLEFQINGIPSAVTGVPQVQQGQLIMTNITVEGLAALILTSDEIQTLANRHLADAQRRLNHSIVSVQLKDQEIDMVLGSPNNPLPILP